MKKISIIAGIILCLHLIFAPIMTAQAATNETLADDTLYYETVIEETASFSPMASNTAKTKTGYKTTYCKNANGTVLWSVTVTARFSYNGTTATCTSSSVSATIKDSTWKISNKYSTRCSNYGTATATGQEYINNKLVKSVTKTVKLTCSPTGTLS
ncbi:MAG: hypothetical protein UE033_10020 [Coprococcus sp.]|nr:hypothetical protein [Coprococcus sp.]